MDTIICSGHTWAMQSQSYHIVFLRKGGKFNFIKQIFFIFEKTLQIFIEYKKDLMGSFCIWISLLEATVTLILGTRKSYFKHPIHHYFALDRLFCCVVTFDESFSEVNDLSAIEKMESKLHSFNSISCTADLWNCKTYI